jgi:hypothetical protein
MMPFVLGSAKAQHALKQIKENAERFHLNFTSHSEEPYNAAFTMAELLTLLG